MIRFLSRWLVILALILLALWPMSYLRSLAICFGRVAVGVQGGWGMIVLTNEPAHLDEDDRWKFASGARFVVFPQSTWLPNHVWSRGGTGSPGGPMRWCSLEIVYIPIWMLALAGAFIALLIRRFIRPSRLTGHCARCNYNLSGNLSGVCPECGQPIQLASSPP